MKNLTIALIVSALIGGSWAPNATIEREPSNPKMPSAMGLSSDIAVEPEAKACDGWISSIFDPNCQN
jgi:hypothetical protein